jgi:hypothetical protein
VNADRRFASWRKPDTTNKLNTVPLWLAKADNLSPAVAVNKLGRLHRKVIAAVR